MNSPVCSARTDRYAVTRPWRALVWRPATVTFTPTIEALASAGPCSQMPNLYCKNEIPGVLLVDQRGGPPIDQSVAGAVTLRLDRIAILARSRASRQSHSGGPTGDILPGNHFLVIGGFTGTNLHATNTVQTTTLH